MILSHPLDYRRVEPHEGYQIIKNWKTKLFAKNEEFDVVFKEKSQEIMHKIATLNEQEAEKEHTIFDAHDSGLSFFIRN